MLLMCLSTSTGEGLEAEGEVASYILSPVSTTYLAIIINRDIHSITEALVGESQTRGE